ncbi:MAG: ABC transporter permease subunit [Spirochaetales bacterium]|uniref:ABC transporter permease subunit n=1 Tax=Candidatus Thalassospirochaeta sargassi TaxID=3119039 RepID=A0AAJ1ILH6_9SPIO|nr:ABC transporter permease subunit [Spirochaetales bacterium]
MKRSLPGTLLWFVILLVVWEITARSGLVSELVLPSITVVFASFGGELISGSLLSGTFVSLGFVVAGILSGAFTAFILAALSFQFAAVKRLSSMLTAVLHPLPGIAVLPILILFFGIGRLTLLMVIIHSVLWPLVVNITAGFSSVPAVYQKIGANYALKSSAFFFRIMLPASFPHIFSGLKTAWARAWRAAVSAEMIFGITGSGGGLGWFVFQKRIFMDTPGMYAGILMLALIGLIVESGLFHLIEAETLKKWGEA